ncbi:MAG TPA: ParA family protein [Gelidibacter sp.]|jgi:chromosome partitioning protein|uniref:ParA family protein n=1 Tax=Gelidibacter sp. TaxID=2018083 RepID=UPI002B841143|nr:ParA family protein [Gelidibacter sp.]HXJ98676.1 ParA family protein [Gelidibacter sp.]
MVITFANQKGGTGKTTIAIAFANYLSVNGIGLKVFDCDFQESIHEKYTFDISSGKTPLYDVIYLDHDSIPDVDNLIEMSDSEELFVFDLPGSLDVNYVNLLHYSDYLIIPFEYSDVSMKSTIRFNEFLKVISAESQRIFIRSKFDKGFSYPNKESFDSYLKEEAKYNRQVSIIEHPIYKRNVLQTIDTCSLTYRQKEAVIDAFKQVLELIKTPIVS